MRCWRFPTGPSTRQNSRRGCCCSLIRTSTPMIALSDAWVRAGALYALEWDYAELGSVLRGARAAAVVGAPRNAAPPQCPRRTSASTGAPPRNCGSSGMPHRSPASSTCMTRRIARSRRRRRAAGRGVLRRLRRHLSPLGATRSRRSTCRRCGMGLLTKLNLLTVGLIFLTAVDDLGLLRVAAVARAKRSSCARRAAIVAIMLADLAEYGVYTRNRAQLERMLDSLGRPGRHRLRQRRSTRRASRSPTRYPRRQRRRLTLPPMLRRACARQAATHSADSELTCATSATSSWSRRSATQRASRGAADPTPAAAPRRRARARRSDRLRAPRHDVRAPAATAFAQASARRAVGRSPLLIAARDRWRRCC